MYRKDYILRMIEMMGELIAAFFGYLKKGNFEKAAETLDNAYSDLLKEDAAFFHKIPPNELTEKLLKEHNYTHDHLEILAELFNAEAELLYAQSKFLESLPFYEKALLLFEFIIKESRTFSHEKQAKTVHVTSKIDHVNTILGKI